MNKQPYVLSIAHPDHKRPWVNNIFGVGLVNATRKLGSYFSEYLYNSIELDVDPKSYTYERYADEYYNYAYMDQLPYELHVFNLETGEWENKNDMIPEIYAKAFKRCLKKIKSEENEN